MEVVAVVVVVMVVVVVGSTADHIMITRRCAGCNRAVQCSVMESGSHAIMAPLFTGVSSSDS